MFQCDIMDFLTIFFLKGTLISVKPLGSGDGEGGYR